MSQITTHVLDTSRGLPAAGIPIVLSHWQAAAWVEIASGITNADGRVSDLLPASQRLSEGRYRLRFSLDGYFIEHQQSVFYPQVDIECNLSGEGEHYHIPLLLSPFGYSTYRGS